MTPSTAIANAEDHVGLRLVAMATLLRDEARGIADEWERLGRIGGQREDHAAELLGRLEPQLCAIERFAAACLAQLAQMRADPFGREEGEP